MSYQKKRIVTASLIVTVITVFGKVFGFARDAVVAAYYGADWKTDAFFFAQSMPSVIFPAVCNSLSTAFLSLYVTKKAKNDSTSDVFASKAITFSLVLALFLGSIGALLSPYVVPLFAPGFAKEQSELAIHLTRIMMSAFVLSMAHYMLGAVLSAQKKYYGAQLAAMLYNVSVIIITVALGKGQSMSVLSYTVVIGHIIQILALIIIARGSVELRLHFGIRDEDISYLIKITIPIIIGNSVVQINNIVDKILSSLFGAGSVSALSYSNNLNRFVTGIFITTLSTVLYPALTEQFSQRDKTDFRVTLSKSISAAIIILLPISIITCFCAGEIVTIVYQRGSFDINATIKTASLLKGYGMMYVFLSVQEIINRAFYGMRDTKTPMKAAMFSIVGNSMLSIALSRIFGLGGIALGTTISSIITSLLLLTLISRRIPDLSFDDLKDTVIKCVISSMFVIATIILCKAILSGTNSIIEFLVIASCSITIHLIILILLKCRVVMEFRSMFIRIIGGKIAK